MPHRPLIATLIAITLLVAPLSIASTTPNKTPEPGAKIPAILLTGDNGLSSMFTNRSEKAFDLYLYLLSKS